MPFEISPKEVSLAEKLAALMEAGRASHPNVKHVHGEWGDGKRDGCAMTFAALGAGVADMETRSIIQRVADALGASFSELKPLAERVITMNDFHNASLPEIIAAIREDKLPQMARDLPQLAYVGPSFYDAFQKVYAEKIAQAQAAILKTYYMVQPQGPSIVYMSASAIDVWKPIEWVKDEIAPPKVAKVPQPMKDVRTSAKTGATWPKPKHAYA